MWELDYKESWTLKNSCFLTVVLEKTLESPSDHEEIKPVNPKGNQSWIFIGRTDAEVEAPILWPPDSENWLTGKDPDVGKDWRQEEKGMTEDEVVGWHHLLKGYEFEQTLEDREAWCAAVHGVSKSGTWLSIRHGLATGQQPLRGSTVFEREDSGMRVYIWIPALPLVCCVILGTWRLNMILYVMHWE